MPTILGANTLSTGYDVANSLRFDDGSSPYLTKAVSSTSNRRTFTYSTWVKRSSLSGSAYPRLFNPFVDSNNFFDIYFRNTDALQIYSYSGGSDNIDLVTTQLFRDVSAWYHIVIAVDTTQGTNSNRVKVYVNGSQVTSFSTSTYPGENADLQINVDGVSHVIGRNESGDNNYFDGYMAETVLIDGSALAPTSFGEFDEDSPTIWKPKSVSGLTFGTNGFYLQFKQSGTSQNSSGLGADTSGNDHHFAVSGLAATDQSTDTCTNNFATLNPLASGYYSSATFSEGNNKIISQKYASIVSTIAVSRGKWYAEMRSTDISAGTGFMGITSNLPNASNYEAYNQSGSIVGYGVAGNGSAYGNGGGFGSWGSWDNNAIIMMAVDLDNNKLYWGVDGTWGNSSDPSAGSNGGSITAASSTKQGVYWFFCNSQTNDNATLEYNFGSPHYAISSGNADANGHGNFEYAVPTNFFSLNTKNLAEYG